MHTLTAQQVSKFQKYMVFVMRLLSLVMVPIGAVVPSVSTIELCLPVHFSCVALRPETDRQADRPNTEREYRSKYAIICLQNR